MKQTHNSYHFLIFLLVVFSLEAILFSVGNFKIEERIRTEEERIKKTNEALSNIPFLAKSVSVYDITDKKKLYGKYDDVTMPIASIAKIMTVVAGLNNHNLDDIIVVSKEAVDQAGDFGIFPNEKWKIGDLAKFTLIVSANDGAFMLSKGKENFLEKLNEKAKKIGMTTALFLNSTGLDVSRDQAGAYASAEDVNLMAMYAFESKPEVFSVTTLSEINLKSESGFMHNFKNTDILIGKIPNLLFSKTGYTELAGGNLVIIFEDIKGHKIAVTVLGSTFDGRFVDMEKIVNVLYNQ